MRRHITVELVYVRLKGRWRRAADIITHSAATVICVIIVIFCLQWAIYLDRHEMRTTAGETPLSLVTYTIVAGFTLNALYSVGILLRECSGISSEVAKEEESSAL